MKSLISAIGILLIIVGIAGLSYRYITYTTNEKILEVGDVKVSAEKEKAIVIPPVLSGACLAGGIVLVVLGRSRKQ